MASYKLPLKSLSFGIQEFKYHLNTQFFAEMEAIDVHAGDIEAVVVVDRKSDDLYQLDFTLKGTLSITCDRCLDDMEHEVDTTYRLSVKEGDDYDDSRDGVLVIPCNWRELDLAPLMRDTALLTIPIKHVHPDGECNVAMLEQLNDLSATSVQDDDDMREGADGTQEENYSLGDDPRWDALKKIKDKN